MRWTRFTLGEVPSTNDFLRAKTGETNLVATAEFQTHGRGQGTNTWESEAGKNLLFSIKISPENIPARDQFILSMAAALALKTALLPYAACTLKWPNDIYLRDRKLSGTLIETTVSGRKVQDCIFGIGLNVNQQQFHAAPNPLSLRELTGYDIDREALLNAILEQFERRVINLSETDFPAVRSEYNAALYRRGERHFFIDAGGRFEAEIQHVEPSGHIILRDAAGTLRSYTFGELQFVI
ncbi:MAG: biotin--[acetyl-CoA-carboxylase] ligase [Prevotella sp.]|nr:biotin--[acetyl-CoA-carboxylase] ligase [Prevotella sp.]